MNIIIVICHTYYWSYFSRIKIVDQNIDVKAIKFGDEVVEEDDEAPLVAEVIDERPVEMKMKEVYEASRWKKLDSASTLFECFILK